MQCVSTVLSILCQCVFVGLYVHVYVYVFMYIHGRLPFSVLGTDTFILHAPTQSRSKKNQN